MVAGQNFEPNNDQTRRGLDGAPRVGEPEGCGLGVIVQPLTQ